MVILTPSASVNYEASAKFIENLTPVVRSRIQLVLCLDSLVTSDKAKRLYIYDSVKSSKSSTRDLFVSKLSQVIDITE